MNERDSTLRKRAAPPRLQAMETPAPDQAAPFDQSDPQRQSSERERPPGEDILPFREIQRPYTFQVRQIVSIAMTAWQR